MISVFHLSNILIISKHQKAVLMYKYRLTLNYKATAQCCRLRRIFECAVCSCCIIKARPAVAPSFMVHCGQIPGGWKTLTVGFSISIILWFVLCIALCFMFKSVFLLCSTWNFHLGNTCKCLSDYALLNKRWSTPMIVNFLSRSNWNSAQKK